MILVFIPNDDFGVYGLLLTGGIQLNKNIIYRYKYGILFFVGLLMFSLFQINWLYECFMSKWEDSTNPNSDYYKDVELVPGEMYSQEFYCIGTDLRKLTFQLNACEDPFGFVSVSIENNKNQEVYNNRYQVAILGGNVAYITIDLDEPLDFGKKYKIIFQYESEMKNQTTALQCYNHNSLFGNLYKNNMNLNLQLDIKCYYNRYLNMNAVLLTVVLIVLIQISLCVGKKNLVRFKGYDICCGILVAMIGYICIEWMNDNINNLSLFGVVANGIPIFVIYIFLLVICGSERITSIVILLVCSLIGICEYYVVLFRAKPILPWDLVTVETAFTIIDNYQYTGHVNILCSVLLCILVLIVVFKFNSEKCFNLRKRFRILVVNIFIIMVYMTSVLPNIHTDIWSPLGSYDKYGTVASFIAFLPDIMYLEPSGYSEEVCDTYLKNEKIVQSNSSIHAENVIVIMNETFSDLRMFDESLLAGEYMPNIDSIQENIIKGNLYVPVYGGGTANSEFEVLTGVSCAYVPSTPYEVFLENNINSLSSSLKTESFSTIAFHPYIAENWNRDVAYDNLGFDQFLSIDNMDNPEYIRCFVSDKSDYDFVIQQDENEKENLFFIFNVTMQNHGGYETADVQSVDLSTYGEFPQAERYLALIQESDKAFGDLVKYYSNVDEPTLICMFGDHQASIEEEFYEVLYGKKLKDLTNEEKQKMYITPFYIWTNYDIKEENIDKISTNYLSTLILKIAGFDLTGYEAFLYRLFQEYPVISTTGVWDKNGVYYKSVDEIDDEILTEYEHLQYYRMQGN